VRVREAQKQATRDRVIAAARTLFEEVGYEQTTIRMIAEAAGVAIGSVFTTFASKDEVLNHILLERFEALFEELDRLAPYIRGATRDRVASLLSIAYGVERQSLGLMLAHLAASHGWPTAIEEENNRRQARLTGLLKATLQRGVAEGDVRADVDLDTYVDMILAVYLRNYRTAWYEQLDAEALSALMERQLTALFTGLTPAAAAEPALAA
jgi:TetR/AcrR family transcriptional regulator, cholesterol catabolism regulator